MVVFFSLLLSIDTTVTQHYLLELSGTNDRLVHVRRREAKICLRFVRSNLISLTLCPSPLAWLKTQAKYFIYFIINPLSIVIRNYITFTSLNVVAACIILQTISRVKTTRLTWYPAIDSWNTFDNGPKLHTIYIILTRENCPFVCIDIQLLCIYW